MKTLYTILVEFGGGTYISQFTAASPQKALSLWAEETHAVNPAPGLRLQIKKQLAGGDDGLESVETCANVWCFSGTHNGKLILIHVVSTRAAVSGH